jgi:predicted PurR-regulated permease PerM
MNRTTEQLRWLVWLIFTGLLIYLCWRMLEPFVDILITAAVLVTVFLPLHQFLLKKTKNESLSSLLTMGLILFMVIAPLVAITIKAVAEAANLASNLQTYTANLQAKIIEGNQFQGYLMKVKQWLNLDALLNSDALKNLLGNSAEFIMKNTMNILGGAVGMIFSIVLVLFTMYYLFRDHQRIIEIMPDFLPMERSQSEALLVKIREVLNASVNGALVIATIQGFLGGILFWILGIPSSIVWGAVMVFFSLVPVVGSAIIWFPAALILLLMGHWIKFLILVLCEMLVIGSIDNLLRPRLVGKKAQMHELMIFFSVMGGIKIFGMLGILLGPIVLSIAIGFLEVARINSPPTSTDS